MKNNNINMFLGKKSSKLVIGVLGISVFALLAYLGVSVAGKGTFSVDDGVDLSCSDCASPTFKYWEHHIIESAGDTGLKCYVRNGVAKNADLVYVIGEDGNGLYGVTAQTPSRFRINGNSEITGYNISGWSKSISHYEYYVNGELKDPNSWECALTDEFTNEAVNSYGYSYMCDTVGQIVIAPLCKKYTDTSSSGNLILSSRANGNSVWCGIPEYYLYGLNELSSLSNCLLDGVTFGNGGSINGVDKCNPTTGAIVNLISCNNDADPTCYTSDVSMRGSTVQTGYVWSTLTDASDSACSLKKCYKCEQQGNTILATTDTPTVTSVPGNSACPEGSSEEEITSCYKNCIYCSDGEIKDMSVYIGYACTGGAGIYEDTPENRASIDCSHYTGPGTGPTPSTTESVICYRCSPTQEEREFTNTTTCPTDGGWIEGRLNCPGGSNSGSSSGSNSVSCSYQYIGVLEDQVWIRKNDASCQCANVAGSGEWLEVGSSGSDDPHANMDCYTVLNSIQNGIYYSLGSIGSCYSGFTKSSDGTRCIKCDSGYNVSGNSCVRGGTNNSPTTTKAVDDKGNVTTNAQTGSSALIIAWIIGVTAIGYAFYYFRQTNTKEN